MDFWLIVFIGGLFGSYIMDVTEAFAEKRAIYSSVNAALIGRWFIGLFKGQFYYADIRESKPVNNETQIGIWFHYLIGGGCVALVYPLFISVTGLGTMSSNILPGLLFGLATSVLPWFILLPSFGWGFFGNKAPNNARPVLASLLSHTAYGLAIGIILDLYGLLKLR